MTSPLATRHSPLTLRRLRDNLHLRELVAEHRVSVQQLIQPLFVVEGLHEREEVRGLTGTFRDTPDSLLRQIESDLGAGVTKFLLFPVPKDKQEFRHSGSDRVHSSAVENEVSYPESKSGSQISQFSSESRCSSRKLDSGMTTGGAFDFAAAQIAAIKQRFGNAIWLAVDVCLCSSTSHGQCGIVNDAGDHLCNDATVQQLAAQAAAFAAAGADCVAPSDMMDGRIAAIRAAIPERTVLMSYSAKFHSRFYGPFRGAADSAPKGEISLQDRATYQIDPPNFNDALRASLRDAEEGADILMVKPGMPYLDVLYRLSSAIPLPFAVYQVSGEYAAIEALSAQGMMDKRLAHVEAWTGFVRAGAKMIITYGARYAKEWLV